MTPPCSFAGCREPSSPLPRIAILHIPKQDALHQDALTLPCCVLHGRALDRGLESGSVRLPIALTKKQHVADKQRPGGRRHEHPASYGVTNVHDNRLARRHAATSSCGLVAGPQLHRGPSGGVRERHR
jgi:hypothetical protein